MTHEQEPLAMFRRIRQFARRARHSPAFSLAALAQIVLVNAFVLFAATRVWADDCSRDWRRAEDCLRTPGFAQGLGTGAAVIGTILINGAAIQTLVLKPPGTGGKDGEPDKQYLLDVRTEGSRTSLWADDEETLWIYAKVTCSDPAVDCRAITASISFTPGGTNADWLTLRQQDLSDFKSIQISALPVASAPPGETGQATMDVSAVCEGGRLTARVPLELETSDCEIVFS
jgi:hypothetical protein